MVSPAVLEEAIETYNEYRSPMATAELVAYAEETCTVRFEGPFCRMSCDYDYFEDLIHEVDALGGDPSSIDVREIDYLGDERYRVEFGLSSAVDGERS